MRELFERMRDRWPLRAVAVLVVGVAVAFVYWVYVPGPDADGAVDKSCPVSDPCARTKEHWVSPQRMRDRFDNHRLGNARGDRLPPNVRQMVTKRWNEDHGVPGKGLLDCGGHWWCKPLEASTCAVSYFLCVGETMGYGQATSTTIHCGGTMFILARAGAPPVAVGSGGTLCVYNDLGHVWGWW